MKIAAVAGLILSTACGPLVTSGDDLTILARLRRQAEDRWADATGLEVSSLVGHCTIQWGTDECRNVTYWACTAIGDGICRIWISPAIPPEIIRHTVTHEIGHALGARHVGSGRGIMAESRGRCISEDDLNVVCKANRNTCDRWVAEC